MALTIPTDVAQFYAFSLKLAQELGYIYGFNDLWASRNDLSEEAKNTLLLYLGVMLGVNGAGALLRSSGVTVAKHVMTTVPQKAVAKAGWYPILKKVMKIFGVTLTRRGLAKGMGKAIPILGGVISGGINLCDYETHGRKIAKRIVQISELF